MQKLGDILVEAEIISKKTLERALDRQKSEKQRLGIVLAEMGVLIEDELAVALAKQFDFKIIKSFVNHVFPQELLDMIPSDFAIKRLIFPLKHKDGMLAVATTDPVDLETAEMLSRITGCQIIPIISTRSEILSAISKNYLLSSNIHSESGSSILVVENSEPVAAIIQVALSQAGYHVLLANDGIEGLRLAEKERPQLVITESVIPRMDGYALFSALKANPMTANIPVIMLTAKASAEDEQRALEAGFIDFIPKPVQPLRIVSRVKRVFELSRKYKL
jgi:CheY-like chemotaxis protein